MNLENKPSLEFNKFFKISDGTNSHIRPGAYLFNQSHRASKGF